MPLPGLAAAISDWYGHTGMASVCCVSPARSAENVFTKIFKRGLGIALMGSLRISTGNALDESCM